MRARDLGLTFGSLPTGSTNSILDVPGVGAGHATVWRDERPVPEGRGIARTGVTVIDLGGSMFRAPVPAGGAVLNGAGECTGFLQISEWGFAETPIFLTSTMQVGRVYDAACELLVAEEADMAPESVVIPVVAECDDSFLNDVRCMQLTKADVASALAGARDSVAGGGIAEGAVGAGTGMSCLGYKGGIGTASRKLSGGHTLAVLLLSNFGLRSQLTIAGIPVGERLGSEPGTEDSASQGAPPAGSCIVVTVTDAPLDSAACTRVARRAGLGLARTGSTARHGSGEIFLALATGLRRTLVAADNDREPGPAGITAGGLDEYFTAVVETTEEAVLNSMVASQSVTGRDGNTSSALPLDAVMSVLRAHNRI